MTGLDKITSQIQEEAEASAKERIEAAQKEAEQILADAKAACEAMEKEASDKAAALKTVQDGRIHSEAKQEIIAEIIGSAYQTLKEEDTASYFLTMEKLVKTYALADKGEIYFSAADLGRMPADFEKKIEAAAQENGGSLTLKKEPKEIPDGFILVYGGVEENCTLKALFDAKKDQLQDRVNEMLFL